jgi:hypothetical protein
VNAVLPDFVTGGGDDSAAVGAADDERFAGGLGVVARQKLRDGSLRESSQHLPRYRLSRRVAQLIIS